MTPEQNQILTKSIAIHADACGITPAEAFAQLKANPALLDGIAEAYRLIAGGTSAFADELMSAKSSILPPAGPPVPKPVEATVVAEEKSP